MDPYTISSHLEPLYVDFWYTVGGIYTVTLTKTDSITKVML